MNAVFVAVREIAAVKSKAGIFLLSKKRLATQIIDRR